MVIQLFMRRILLNLFLSYLRVAASVQLRKIHPLIIGVTGSAGKTSCKEAIYAILKDQYRVKEGKKSFNSEVGLPLDILGFDANYGSVLEMVLRALLLTPWQLLTNWEKYDVYLAEMGVDKPGDMSYLLSFIHPSIGVFLNALPVHTANFLDGVDGIAREKGKLISALPSSGSAILNADDPRVLAFEQKTQAKVLTFGQREGNSVRNFTLNLPGFVLTKDYGATLAAAVAVGKALGINEKSAKARLKVHFKLPPGRMSVFKGINGSTLIDSTYNASKVPMIGALKVLRQAQGKRKIAILGDMRELGELAQEEHEALALEAVQDADVIFTFGPLMKSFLAPKALELGFPQENLRVHEQMLALADDVFNFIKNGDVILLKGSQNTILLETLVERLLADPSDAQLLCRRGEFWNKKRAELLIGV